MGILRKPYLLFRKKIEVFPDDGCCLSHRMLLSVCVVLHLSSPSRCQDEWWKTYWAAWVLPPPDHPIEKDHPILPYLPQQHIYISSGCCDCLPTDLVPVLQWK